MKCSVLQESLSKVLGIVSQGVATRSTLPVLSHILLGTDGDGRLQLTATNLEMGIACWLPAKVTEDGIDRGVTLPARSLVDLIGAMPQERVDLALDPRTWSASIQCGRFSNTLRGIDGSEFPLLRLEPGPSPILIDPTLLKQAITSVVPCAATDDSRPILTGVLFEFCNEGNEGTLTMAAADGFRLAVYKAKVDHLPFDGARKLIVPSRALREVERVLADQEKKVSITIQGPEDGPTGILFEMDDVSIVASLIDGNFANYAAIIPKLPKTMVEVMVADLIKAVRVAMVFGRESNDLCHFTFEPATDDSGLVPGRVKVRSVSAETGDSNGEFDAKIKGAGLGISFSGKYILAALEAVKGLGAAVVRIGLETSESPALVTPASGDVDYRHVVMPMRIR